MGGMNKQFSFKITTKFLGKHTQSDVKKTDLKGLGSAAVPSEF